MRFDRLTGIDAVHASILIGGSLVLVTSASWLMIRANRRERDVMQRRRQEWLDAGGNPDDEPNFFSGSSGT